jgi:glucose/arabinose dehydrogenase
MRLPGAAALALSLSLWAAPDILAQTCPAIELQSIVHGSLMNPIFVTHAGDGTERLFIVEQAGAIRVLQPGSDSPTLFLRIPAARVLSGGERGLLGLAFHPDFASNRRFFVYYTKPPDGDSVIAEYKASAGDPNVADPTPTTATETVLLTFAQPFANHNGGSMAFGPDGFLYIASGDGGSGNDPGNRAQNLNSLLGKILRIDVDTPTGPLPYSSPPDNPYAGATPGRDEIFAIGMRNPWRMSFDRLTGQLVAGDVGQGAREEVSIITLGGNYGWRVMEGTRCNIAGDPLRCNSAAFTPPALEYIHGSGRCSVTGGYVYRGASGTLADGTYVYGDFCTGEIFGADVADLPLDPGDLPATPHRLRDSSYFLASFGEDEAGELYAVDLKGQVSRLLAAVRIAPSASTFDERGGDGTVDVTSPRGCPAWTAVSNDPWITIDAGASGTGNGTVSYNVGANPNVAPRTGIMTIAGRSFTVEQAGGPAPLLSIDDVVLMEGPGAQASFTVSLDVASLHTVTVHYEAANGTATASADFVPPVPAVLSFEPGETSKAVTVGVNDDVLDEDEETFVVNLSRATKAAIADPQGVGTIADDDPLPSISIADASFIEGFGVRRLALNVALSARSGRPVAVDYVVGPGSLIPGTEFRAESGTLVFAPGATRQGLFVWTKGDRADEPDETFVVDLQRAVNATIAASQATGTIVDDDRPPRFRITP